MMVTDKIREELLVKLKNRFILVKNHIRMMDAIIKTLTQPKELYDWRKDKSLSVNS